MKQYLPIIFMVVVFFYSCADHDTSTKNNGISEFESRFYSGKGVGPVKNLVLSESIDTAMSEAGSELFQAKCIACHHTGNERKIGPGLGNITGRRTPEWIMNQILNPLEMAQKDSLTRELLSIYLTQMTPMDLSEKEARAVLEFLRTK